MNAYDDVAAEQVAEKNPELVKWRGKTTTQWHDPTILPKYGWSLQNRGMSARSDIDLGGAVAASGLSGDEDDWVDYRATHNLEWKGDDESKDGGSHSVSFKYRRNQQNAIP
jgi:hypothetical protein